jgi:molybdopterin adenylyltransferase
VSTAPGDGPLRIGVVTVSDRAASGTYADEGGPAVRRYLEEAIAGAWTCVARLVPDERDVVARTLADLVDAEGCALVVTTGGTGPAPRDVTPEATADVCDRLLPGFGEAMRAASQPTVPTALLSRQLAGHRGTSLLLNLPGRPAAIAMHLDAVWPAVPHCVRLLGGPDIPSARASRPGG